MNMILLCFTGINIRHLCDHLPFLTDTDAGSLQEPLTNGELSHMLGAIRSGFTHDSDGLPTSFCIPYLDVVVNVLSLNGCRYAASSRLFCRRPTCGTNKYFHDKRFPSHWRHITTLNADYMVPTASLAKRR